MSLIRKILLVEEVENMQEENDSFANNYKLASSIAKRELKILKIFQEWAEEVKWICWKILLPTNLFYNHEWILHLIGWEDNNLNQSEGSMYKETLYEFKTPFDALKNSGFKNIQFSTPIDLNLSGK